MPNEWDDGYCFNERAWQSSEVLVLVPNINIRRLRKLDILYMSLFLPYDLTLHISLTSRKIDLPNQTKVRGEDKEGTHMGNEELEPAVETNKSLASRHAPKRQDHPCIVPECIQRMQCICTTHTKYTKSTIETILPNGR